MTTHIYIIYKYTCNITGKSYIGQTSQHIKQRWNEHKSRSFCPKNKQHNYHFHNAIRKYGASTWTHEILFTTNNKSIVSESEIFLISYYDTFYNGYNSTTGGEFFRHTEYSKKKLSISRVGKLNPRFKGYYHTPFGIFESRRLSIKNITHMSGEIATRWCKNPDKIISSNSLSQSKYLKSLKESPLGKTFNELGFWFEPIYSIT